MGRRAIQDGILQEDPPRLIGGTCRNCGSIAFPSLRFCPACGTDDELEPTLLGTVGTVYSFTVVRQAPPGREVPYVLAYVDLREGVRVMAQIAGMEPEEVEIGATVELAIEPIGVDANGDELIGYRFRPALVSAMDA